MKLFVASVSFAKAQLSLGDNIEKLNIDAGLIDEYKKDYTAAADAQADSFHADEVARYFGGATATVTPASTTVTTTITNQRDSYCVKCDVMDVAQCVVTATSAQKCANGDVCFLEVRRNNPRTGNALTQLCTGCKNPQACYNLKSQNSASGGNTPRGMMQCFPAVQLARIGRRLGEISSVCRTCFVPSASDFSGVVADDEKVFLTAIGPNSISIPQSADGSVAPASANLAKVTFIKFNIPATIAVATVICANINGHVAFFKDDCEYNEYLKDFTTETEWLGLKIS